MPTRITAFAVSKSFNGRTGIIGENGTGKSTLLRLFAGCERPDRGEIVVDAEGGVGYPVQGEQLPAHLSVQRIIDRSLDEVRRIEDRLRRLEREMFTGDESHLREYSELATLFELRGGCDADARLERALHGLGLGPRDGAVGGLSGREQVRSRMAALLAARPEVLLDEPADHLSPGLVDEPEVAPGEYRGALVVVGHDRRLRERWRGARLDMRAPASA